MNKPQKKRNWSEYNETLKRHARIEVLISPDLLAAWDYEGVRLRGGVMRYRDSVIEMCLLVREYFGLRLRQTEGFIQSLLMAMDKDLLVPDYTTLSRRAGSLQVCLRQKVRQLADAGEELVLAVDSTGLSVHRRDEWNREKHGRVDGRWQETWRKLHICIDTKSGEIKKAVYTLANVNDSTQMQTLLEDIPAAAIKAVCGDMGYDTLKSRKAVYDKGAAQLIPPVRKARPSSENRNLRRWKNILKQRDDAVHYIRHNTINGDNRLARAQWKKDVGYHTRSLVETAMWRIKTHAGTKLTNRKEQNRKTQAYIKCKLVNILATL